MPNPDPNFTRTPHSQPSHLNALTSTYNQAAVYGPPGSAARLLLGEVLPLPGFDASPNTPQRAAAEARAAAAMARAKSACRIATKLITDHKLNELHLMDLSC